MLNANVFMLPKNVLFAMYLQHRIIQIRIHYLPIHASREFGRSLLSNILARALYSFWLLCGGTTLRSLFGRLVSLTLMYGSYFSSRQVEYREYREYRIETQKWLEVEEDWWPLKIPFWRIL